jgi:hypothetical protein
MVVLYAESGIITYDGPIVPNKVVLPWRGIQRMDNLEEEAVAGEVLDITVTLSSM